MATILVVGSIAIDSIKTPYGSAENVIGGSATHFSYTAALFNPVRLVGVVGEDFPKEFLDILRERPICTEGLQVKPGRSFRWTGRYGRMMAGAETLSVELNLFGEFDPVIPEIYRASEYIFLANGSPRLQARVLDQVARPRFTVVDTMNLWINTERKSLLELLKRVDALVINEEEIRMLMEEPNLVAAGRKLLERGLRYVIVKKGEHGALLLGKEGFFACPAYPVDIVRDPTGAGDTFAGGLMGELARSADGAGPAFGDLKRAIAYGTVTASFNVEDFSLNRLRGLTIRDVEARFHDFLGFTQLDGDARRQDGPNGHDRATEPAPRARAHEPRPVAKH